MSYSLRIHDPGSDASPLASESRNTRVEILTTGGMLHLEIRSWSESEWLAIPADLRPAGAIRLRQGVRVLLAPTARR